MHVSIENSVLQCYIVITGLPSKLNYVDLKPCALCQNRKEKSTGILRVNILYGTLYFFFLPEMYAQLGTFTLLF